MISSPSGKWQSLPLASCSFPFSQWQTSERMLQTESSRGRKWTGVGWFPNSSLSWVDLSLGEDSGGRANWWVTHNQPPYHSPTKLDCIHILVIHSNLANVSHSSPEPRQLWFIKSRSGLYFPSSDCYSPLHPSVCCLLHPVFILRRCQVKRQLRFCWPGRSKHPSPIASLQ